MNFREFHILLDFSHLGVLHTATVRPSTKTLGTFCRLLRKTDTQKVALVKRTCSCWKARALRKVGWEGATEALFMVVRRA
jgi:hypothetical protein